MIQTYAMKYVKNILRSIYWNTYVRFRSPIIFKRKIFALKIEKVLKYIHKNKFNPNIRLFAGDVYLLSNDGIWMYFNMEDGYTLGDGQNCDYYYDQERSNIEKILMRSMPANGTYIDVGANNGYFYSLKIAMAYPHSRVIAVEPDAGILKHLYRNIKINNLGNIEIAEIALSRSTGESFLTKGRDASNYLLINDNNIAHQKVNTSTLDSLVENLKITSLFAIKVDIEGGEVSFLDGAKCAIERYKPLVIMEIDDALLKRSGTSRAEALAIMDNYGYDIKYIDGRDYLFVNRNGKDINCIKDVHQTS